MQKAAPLKEIYAVAELLDRHILHGIKGDRLPTLIDYAKWLKHFNNEYKGLLLKGITVNKMYDLSDFNFGGIIDQPHDINFKLGLLRWVGYKVDVTTIPNMNRVVTTVSAYITKEQFAEPITVGRIVNAPFIGVTYLFADWVKEYFVYKLAEISGLTVEESRDKYIDDKPTKREDLRHKLFNEFSFITKLIDVI